MFVLSLNDDDISHALGIFDNESEVLEFLKSVPYVSHNSGSIYEIPKSVLPSFTTMKWKDAVIPLTSYTFSGETDPYFSWQELSHIPTTHGIADGQTLIDNYIYDNNEVEGEVALRNSLKAALKDFFEKEGKEVSFGGFGSQDGEYLLVNGEIYMHIDPMLIDEWKKTRDIEVLSKNWE